MAGSGREDAVPSSAGWSDGDAAVPGGRRDPRYTPGAMRYRLAPSLLAADFARLADEIARVEGAADLLHLDLMDGHFVPNLSFGIPVLRSIRPVTEMPFDCHVMTSNPESLVEAMAEAGADHVSMHIEAVPDPTNAAKQTRDVGMGFGLVMSPGTPWGAVEPFAELCDMIVVMTVEPGFGGQTFMSDALPKMETARKWVDSHGLETDIEVDGGVTEATAPYARDAGASVFVAGTSVFRAPDPVAAARHLRDVIEGRG